MVRPDRSADGALVSDSRLSADNSPESDGLRFSAVCSPLGSDLGKAQNHGARASIRAANTTNPAHHAPNHLQKHYPWSLAD